MPLKQQGLGRFNKGYCASEQGSRKFRSFYGCIYHQIAGVKSYVSNLINVVNQLYPMVWLKRVRMHVPNIYLSIPTSIKLREIITFRIKHQKRGKKDQRSLTFMDGISNQQAGPGAGSNDQPGKWNGGSGRELFGTIGRTSFYNIIFYHGLSLKIP